MKGPGWVSDCSLSDNSSPTLSSRHHEGKQVNSNDWHREGRVMVQDKGSLRGGVGIAKEEVFMSIRKFYSVTFLDGFFRDRIGVSVVLFWGNVRTGFILCRIVRTQSYCAECKQVSIIGARGPASFLNTLVLTLMKILGSVLFVRNQGFFQ